MKRNVYIKSLFTVVFYTFMLFAIPMQGAVWHVDIANQTAQQLGSTLYPFNSIFSGYNAANAGDTIKVAQGQYNTSLIVNGKHIILLGSYIGGTSQNYTNGQGGDFMTRDYSLYPSVINGQSSAAVIEFRNNSSQSRVDGFTIQNGQRGILFDTQFTWPAPSDIVVSHNVITENGPNTLNGLQGGGIRYAGDNHIIEYNTISYNKADRGGGIAGFGLNTIIRNNMIDNNDGNSDHGGGVYVFGNVLFENNIVSNNRVGTLVGYGWGGGALFLETEGGGSAVSRYNIYKFNYAPTYGGGVFADEACTLEMAHDWVYGNYITSGSHGGAGVAVDRRWDGVASHIIMNNCTVADNYGENGGVGNGIYIDVNSMATIQNSIFWNNGDDFFISSNGGILNISYSISEEVVSGTGMLHIDPLFADSDSENYAIKSKAGRYHQGEWLKDNEHSPAIDAGDPTSSYSDEPVPNGNRINIGAMGGTPLASLTAGTKYLVGPLRTYTTLQQVVALLNPGDTVEVDGGHTYPGGVTFNRPGTDLNKIWIMGMRDANSQRPIISGGTNTVAFTTPWPYNTSNGGHHYIFEGFEVMGGSSRCIFHQARDLTIRDCFVRDCPNQGILGADQGSGNITIERTEVARCGSGTQNHQIYMATDEVNNPGSFFRLQHCYIHQGNGGNNIKSRAERNEIYFNWIEGGRYHELELIGADVNGDGGNPHLAREDSDVVGNVLVKNHPNNPNGYVIRIGGDGTGASHGRYRFVNNTVISGTGAVFRMFHELESVEIHNNVFYNPIGSVNLTRTVEAIWTSGQSQIAGANNWVKTGTINIPTQLTNISTGSSPGFEDFSSHIYTPAENSTLVNAGTLPSIPVPGYPFPFPLETPEYVPTSGTVSWQLDGHPRWSDGTIDIGAFERINLPLATLIDGNRNVCSSQLAQIYSAVAIGADEYLWTVVGGSITGYNTTQDTISVLWDANANQHQVSVVPVHSQNGNGLALDADIIIVAADTLIWNGVTHEWSDRSNWSVFTLPQQCHNVIISETAISDPLISQDESHYIKSIIIETGKVLTIQSGGVLVVE